MPVLQASEQYKQVLKNVNITFASNTGTSIFFQYSPIMPNTGTFQYLGPEVYFFPGGPGNGGLSHNTSLANTLQAAFLILIEVKWYTAFFQIMDVCQFCYVLLCNL